MNPPTHLPTLFGRATLVSDGHTTLKDAARALRDLFAPQARDRDVPDSEMRATFHDFAERVLAHFALEEGGSYFGTLEEDSPGLVDQIAHLVGEHHAMRADLERLRAAVSERPRPSGFDADLARLLDAFEAHERHESRVLEKFFLAETGQAG